MQLVSARHFLFQNHKFIVSRLVPASTLVEAEAGTSLVGVALCNACRAINCCDLG